MALKFTRKRHKEASASTKDPDLLKLGDGDKVKILPLQELDEEGDSYDEDMGSAMYVKIWKHPRDWTKELVDTSDEEGGCVPKELARIKGNWKYGWKNQDRVYLNVLVDNGTDEPFVAYVQSSLNSRATVGPALEDYEENNGTIQTWFSYSREGSGMNDTNYTFSPLAGKRAPEVPDVSQYKDQLIDLTTKVNIVPYDEQESWLGVTDVDRVEKADEDFDEQNKYRPQTAKPKVETSGSDEDDPDW